MPSVKRPIALAREARIQDRFRRRTAQAITDGRVFRYLVGSTIVLTVASGVVVWIIDRKDFPTLGDALWWALVTLATVGYGDIVPHSAWGRVVGSAVIVMGVTFLSVLTAVVTSYFVSAEQEKRIEEARALRGDEEEATQALLHEINDRLKTLEERLGRQA
jgi:voltage-gated potassium channel